MDYTSDLFGEKVEEEIVVREVVINKKSTFNIFLFTDALGARKKKDAWILYHKALASGMTPEEVFWKVVWQIKNMLIVRKINTAAEAGLNPFVYSKAKGFLKNFKEGELERLSEELVSGYHNARRGKGEIETLVEKFVLNL